MGKGVRRFTVSVTHYHFIWVSVPEPPAVGAVRLLARRLVNPNNQNTAYVTLAGFYGSLVSSPKDSNPAAGATTAWRTLSWAATTPAGTAVKFQVAGSNSASGPFNFVGPDGTPGTYFTAGASSLAQFNGFRFLKYKAYLSTTGAGATPTLAEVSLCY